MTFIETDLFTLTNPETVQILSGVAIIAGVGLWIAHLKGWLK